MEVAGKYKTKDGVGVKCREFLKSYIPILEYYVSDTLQRWFALQTGSARPHFGARHHGEGN